MRGWTPLHMAAYNGYRDVAELLVADGADVNARDNHNWTPLPMTAANWPRRNFD